MLCTWWSSRKVFLGPLKCFVSFCVPLVLYRLMSLTYKGQTIYAYWVCTLKKKTPLTLLKASPLWVCGHLGCSFLIVLLYRQPSCISYWWFPGKPLLSQRVLKKDSFPASKWLNLTGYKSCLQLSSLRKEEHKTQQMLETQRWRVNLLWS